MDVKLSSAALHGNLFAELPTGNSADPLPRIIPAGHATDNLAWIIPADNLSAALPTGIAHGIARRYRLRLVPVVIAHGYSPRQGPQVLSGPWPAV